MDFLYLATNRQSCRSFDGSKPIPEWEIEHIISAVRLSPSARNSQPYTVFAVTQKETLEKVRKACQMANKNAFLDNCNFILVFELNKPNMIDKLAEMLICDFAPIDMGIAIANATLQAQSAGIGSCIIGWINEKRMKEALGMEKKDRLGLAIAFGYPTENYPVRQKTRKSVDELVKYR